MKWIGAIAGLMVLGLLKTLEWKDNDVSGKPHSFNVYWRSTADSGSWTLVTNVTTTNAVVELRGTCGFFTVTSSNEDGEKWMVRK